LIERLIFGCGRLTGGASEREALALVDTCLAAGIRHFDTAPSYGLGTAEAVIGKALGSAGPEVRITAKVGSSAPKHALAKTWARRAKRLFSGETPRLSGGFAPVDPQTVLSHSDFSAAAMRRSAERSAERLSRIDWLLLHEALPVHGTAQTIGLLEELGARIGAIPGYSNGAQLTASADAAFPPGWIAQAAIRPEWLTAAPTIISRQIISLHSIALTGQWRSERDPAFAAKVAAAAREIGPGSPETCAIAVFYALAAAHLPDARLIVASSHRQRLAQTLTLLAALDQNRCRAIAAPFCP
jgi:hypothetical protein